MPRHCDRHGRRTCGTASPSEDGRSLVASRALFGSCHWIVSTLLPRYGIEIEFVDGSDLAHGQRHSDDPPPWCCWRAHPTRCSTSLICAQSARLAHEAGALVVVDNVFATPLLQQPFELGADIVVYSCTKHIDGQGRVLGGAVLGRRSGSKHASAIHPQHRAEPRTLQCVGAAEELETLALRVEAGCAVLRRRGLHRPASCRQPRALSHALDHPQHTLAMSQMSAGGTVVTFELRGGKTAAFAFMNALRLIAISNNLGDTKSLVTHPATTTHMRIGAEERQRLGITDGVIRLSVGLEDAGGPLCRPGPGFCAVATIRVERQAAE